jgi:hypothetical protein
MKIMKSVTSAARVFSILSFFGFFAVAPALAQTGYGDGAAAQQQMGQQEFDDKTLQKFVDATAALGSIQDSFAKKLEGVQDQEEAMSIQRKMNEKMVSAVQDKGLEVQTYNAIANQMGVNGELRDKVNAMLQEQK